MAKVVIEINDADLEKLRQKTLKFVDKVSSDTNIDSNELIQKIGARAVTSAMAVTTSNISPAKFKSKTPAKMWYRKLVGQRYVNKYLKGGVWYAPVGKRTETPKKKKKDSAKNPVLQEFAKKRTKRRKDPKQPFFSPAPIAGAKKKGLKEVKVLIYLRGSGAQRRKGKFGTLPYLKDNIDKSDRITWVRNTAAGKLGWNNAIAEIPMAEKKDKGKMIPKDKLTGQVELKRKSRVTHTAATDKSGAGIRITNLVKYAGLTHVGAGSNRHGMVMAMNWFNGFWGKRQKKAHDNYKKKFRNIVK